MAGEVKFKPDAGASCYLPSMGGVNRGAEEMNKQIK
jgi:hypothetical protein